MIKVTEMQALLNQPGQLERAKQLLTERNLTLSPAINETRLGAWERPNNVSVYRLCPSIMEGRRAVGEASPAAGERD